MLHTAAERPDASSPQPLAIGEAVVGPPELRLGALSLVNVDEQVVPADDVPVRTPERKSARLVPAVDAIEASSTYSKLEGLS